MDATACDLRLVFSVGFGWQKGGDRFGSSNLTSDITPGGPHSGCPGSMSRTATPGHILLCILVLSVISLFVTIRQNVDFPDDLGPQTKSMGVSLSLPCFTSLAISRFQMAGDFRSCSIAFLGPSVEEPRTCHVCRSVGLTSFQRLPNIGDSLSRFRRS